MNQRPEHVGLAIALVLVLLLATATAMAQTPPPRNPYPGGDHPSQRAQWFMQMRRSRDSLSPAAHRFEALQEAAGLPVLRPRLRFTLGGAAGAYGLPGLGSDWTELGPRPQTSSSWGNVAGRLTAIAVDLGKDPSGNTVYLGGADGGLWVSTNALAASPTFTPIGDNLPSLSIGSIALDDSTTPTTIYVGTGEPNESLDSYYGDGIFKSTDGGQTWTAGSGVSLLGSHISSLLIDPSNPQVLIAGTNIGIVRSIDGGASWSQVSRSFAWGATDVVYDPADQDFYAAIFGGELERSTDQGQTWTDLPNPFLPATDVGRISLAVRGTTLFALVANEDGSPLTDCTGCTGLMESGDEGQTWTPLSLPDGLFYNGVGHQGWYDQYIAAPAGSSELIVAGIDVWLGTPGSGDSLTWTNVTNSYTFGPVHPDQHAIWCLSPQSWIIANDGGAWSTADAGTDWTNLNATLGTIQFYGISAVPGTPGTVFGGSQDNGTALVTAGAGTAWREAWAGDGGYTAVNPSDPSQLFTENFDVSLHRSDDGGDSWQPVLANNTITGGTQFYVPYILDPTDLATAYLLTNDTVWRGPAVPSSPGTGWQSISPPLVDQYTHLSVLAAAPNAPGVLYVGASDGSLEFSSDAEATSTQPTWTQLQPANDNGQGPVSAIAVSPLSAHTLYWGLGYLGTSAFLFKSTDGGQTAVNIAGDLPGVPINAILIDPNAPDNIYVATDAGVFLATDGGTANEQWSKIGDNLPAAAALGLALTLDPNGNPLLLVGTHGRGAWSVPAATLNTAEAVLSTSGLVFPPQTVASPGTGLSITLRNVGGATLTLNGITTSGDFSQTNNCGSSLAAGAACSITVSFKPTAAGPRAGSLAVADNSAISSQIAALSGTGLSAAPVAILSATSLTFPSQAFGSSSSPQGITLTNDGENDLAITSIAASGDFSQTNTCGSSLAGGANCAITVTFKPSASGNRSGALTVTDNAAGSPQTVSLSGTGTAAPAVTLSPWSLSFADQVVGAASKAQSVTLTNTGDLALTLTSVAASGDFSQTNTCGNSVAAGANCAIAITFTPTATGSRASTVTITDNAPDSPQTVTLTGIGVAPATAALSATSLAFASQEAGSTSAAQTVTLTNNGGVALSISSVGVTGPFTETNTCGSSVDAGEKCTIAVTFKPAAAGAATGSVTLSDNAAGAPQIIALTGTGVAPQVTLSATTLDFASQPEGSASAAQNITLTNGGGAALTVSSIAVSGDFAETNTCGASVAAGANCTIAVTFTPKSATTENGTLTINDDAPGSPQTVALTGTGVGFTLAPPATTSATVTAGSPASFTLSLSPGNFTGTVALSCTGAPAQSSCTVSPASASLTAGRAPQPVTVTLTTTASSFAPPLPASPQGGPAGPAPWLWCLGLAALLGLALRGSGWAGHRAPAQSGAKRVAWRSQAWAPRQSSEVAHPRRRWRRGRALAPLLGAALLAAACGGGAAPPPPPSQNSGTPRGTYTVDVIATSGAMSQTIPLTVTVQ